MPIQDQIKRALKPLVGLPLWGAGRASNMQMFAFGRRHKRIDRKGEENEVGDYALHIQCPWRLVGLDGIVVGSIDRTYPADEDSDWQQFDEEKDIARLENRLNMWLEEHHKSPLEIQKLEADPVGGFRIFLDKNFVLEAFPAHSLRGEYSEHWRIFRPSLDDKPWRIFRPSMDGSHFVVCGYGVEGDS